MRGAGWISELVDRVGVGEPAQAGELADALASVELQFGRPMGEQEAPQLALAEQVIELGRRHIDQEQHQLSKAGSRRSDARRRSPSCATGSLPVDRAR